MIMHQLQKNTENDSNLLSEYCSDIANNYQKQIGNVSKFIQNLGNKSKYIHLYLSLGTKLVIIHGILKFR